ncbi:unnamed protein product, partial [Brenthis ino]
MTNKDDDEDSTCNPRVAALLAVHLVSQVLDEAFIIVNAAKESGEPWKYSSSLKKLRNQYLCDESHDTNLTFTVSRGDNRYIYENVKNITSSTVATSTPQKMDNTNTKRKNEASIIGQGDEEFEVKNHELRKSTSMFINHLFDMSDVERVIICEEPCVQDTIMSDENLPGILKKIVESYVESAVDIAFARQIDELGKNAEKSLQISEHSSYSFLEDAYFAEINKDFMIYEYPQNQGHKESIKWKTENINCEVEEYSEIRYNERNDIEPVKMYEDAYLTLNRDYEQYSEEEEPVLQDPKSISLQEVELITTNTPSNVTPRQDEKALVAVSGVSTSGTRKSSLARRCRIQGARLLSCLRGWWWRRKLLGRRKAITTELYILQKVHAGSIRGLCPLSPDARRRASSLLDQRNLRTPSPSRSVAWKFNTVNEALVHSSRWKDFGYKMSLNENDEF